MISPTALAEARILAGLSQRELAKRVGLNYQIIRRAELGRPARSLKLEEFLRLAGVLGVAPEALLQTHNPAPSPAAFETEELSVGEARLLRGLQTGRRTTRSLSRIERELLLPRLIRENLTHPSSLRSAKTSQAPSPQRRS